MADPRGLFGGSDEDNDDDKNIALKPMGEIAAAGASVESALQNLEQSLKTEPKGIPAKQLFKQARAAVAT
jgi:hypothetical protein